MNCHKTKQTGKAVFEKTGKRFFEYSFIFYVNKLDCIVLLQK